MFYYPNVLHRHTGCFSTIWLAATKGIRVTRRELLGVNVRRTCQDIMDYVTAQVPPLQPNLPRPRFSLYLSSQLQYGVVIVYHRQCGFLLEEVQQTIERLLRSQRHIKIDMAEPDRMILDVPDSLFLMEEAEGAQDPFFGLMEPAQLPSPYKLHQPVLVMEEAASQQTLVPGSQTSPDKEGFRSPLAAITLTEKEQFVITAAECFEGPDIPEATATELDMLMDQQDQFRGDVEEPESNRELEGAGTSVDLLKEAAPGPDGDSVWLLDEETGQPVEVPLATVSMEMTPPVVAMPTPPPGSSERASSCREVAVPPNKRPGGGRRRQLVFADPQVQISDDDMKEQIGDPRAETLSLPEMLLDLRSTAMYAAPAQLFSAPSASLVHPDLQLLWKQCAQITVLPPRGKQHRGEEERGESEQDREILRTERKRRQSSMKEITRDSVDPGLQPTEASSVSDVVLDLSKEDRSHSDLITPISRWSPQEEVQVPMEPIVEENIEIPEAETESSDITALSLLSLISSSLQRAGKLTFDSLLPPEAARSTAAHTLYTLLELLSAGQLTVHQTKPYSDITINPGPITVTS